MQFQIPQDVQIEDKIISFLTMKHLFILGVGGGLDYAIYVSLAKNYLWPVWAPPVVFVGGLTLAIAFLKIGKQEIPFIQYILYFISYNIRARKRTWQQMKADVLVSSFSTFNKPTRQIKKIEEKKQNDNKKIKGLDELTRIVDSYGQMNKEKHEKMEELIGKRD